MYSAGSVVFFVATRSVPGAVSKPAAGVPSNGGGVRDVRNETNAVLNMNLVTCLSIKIHPMLPCDMLEIGSSNTPEEARILIAMMMDSGAAVNTMRLAVRLYLIKMTPYLLKV